MPDILYPGVYLEELPAGARPIPGVGTSTAGFVGTAKDGIVGRPIAVRSFYEFEAHFGGLEKHSEMSYAVRQFFLNGGREAVVVRVQSYDDTGDLASVFLGDRARRGGIYALEGVELFNLLCLPGVANPEVLAAAAAYCGERSAFLIVDAPSAAATPDEMLAFVEGATLPQTDHAAVYYPWIAVPDPLDSATPRMMPPSGTIAGLFARTDAAHGVWKAAAGTGAQLMNVSGVGYRVTDAENGRLNPRAVNCVRVFPSIGPVCWGARTLAGADRQGSEWKYIPVRRFALFIEESIKRGLDWVVFEPNDEPLWARVRLSVEVFMHRLFRQGAFQGQTPREGFFIRCDGTTTSPADIDSGILNIHVGFAPLKPSEFVILKIRHTAGEIPMPKAEMKRMQTVARFDELALPERALQQLRDVVAQARDRSRGAVLFNGTGGTAKTMAAAAIANELALDLYRVDSRHVIGKYIGETEKNIDRILTAAEAVDAVLFFDEADALFGKRTDVDDSHDRYANQEVSYLLQRIEAYDGLAILATNLTEPIDPVVSPRFRHIVQLPGDRLGG